MFDFFAPKKPQQQQQQPSQQQQNPNQVQGNGNPMGGQGGDNTNSQTNGQNTQTQQQANPLDGYSKMWDTPAADTDKPPTFSIDPKIMDQVTTSQNFMQGIDPALMQKATSGDINSLMEVMHHVGRNAYRSSIEHGGMLTDKFVGAREQYGQKGLGSKVREELTTHALSNTPNFQHPVVKRQLTEIAQRFSKQHPDASPQEIAEMSKKYLNDLRDAMNPESSTQQNQKTKPEERGEEFWNGFFDENQDQGS